MRFPLREDDRREIREFQLRSACCHCAFVKSDGTCGNEWPNVEQAPWPLAGEDGHEPAEEIALCKEFELQ